MHKLFAGVAVLIIVGAAAYALAGSDAQRPVRAVAAPAALAVPSHMTAGDCCRVVVTGCGKRAKVCVPGECSLDNQKKCRQAFKKAYSCSSTSVSSYIGTCNGETCDIDLR